MELQVQNIPRQYEVLGRNQKLQVRRNSFRDATQDSFTKPPAQNPDLFEALTNVLPPRVEGVLKRRWGYQLWSSATSKFRNAYEYQRDADLSRRIIGTAADGTGVAGVNNVVSALNEDGTVYNASIFVPSATAVSPKAVNSNNYEFFSDQVPADLLKWDGSASGGTSKWGIASPTTAPSVAGASGTNASWSASTYFTTFGAITDSNSNIQQLISVNAKGDNASGTVGTSGVGQPAWNNTPGSTTTDTPVTWTNRGPIGLWQPSHFYNEGHFGSGTLANPAIIYDPGSNALFFNNQGGGGTSGTTMPGFQPVIGTVTVDGTARWEFLASCDPTTPVSGTIAPISTWRPNNFYTQWGGTNNFTKSAVTEPSTVLAAYNPTTNLFTQEIFLMSSGGGTTPATETAPPWATTAGQFTDDGQLRWLCLGTAAWQASTPVTAWAAGLTNFTTIQDSNGNIQVCTVSGTTKIAPHPTWATTYGATTTDGTATWTCVGVNTSWHASSKFFLPLAGFVPPASTFSFGATIVDTNNVLEGVQNSGLSGTSAPTWAAVGSTTTDNTVTWFAIEAVSTNAGSVTLDKGRQYFVVFENSVSGGLSDVSPVSIITGAITSGQVFLFAIPVSTDPQVDQKIILATADGGDQTILYFVAQIANATTTYTDTMDEPTLLAQNVYAFTDTTGANFGVFDNTPPPANGFFPIKHRGRLYLTDGKFLFFSKNLAEMLTPTGVVAGKYEEAWPAANSIDISSGSEHARGLFSDGEFLYIGTDRHILRLVGDGPTNYQPPQAAFSLGGLNNSSSWVAVYIDGNPTGMMFLTPDFRVIASDFNNFVDVGTPIQDVLNSINPAAGGNISAVFYASGAYNFYVLAIPTGINTDPDTLCVFDLKSKSWYIWTLTDSVLTMLYQLTFAGVPQMLFWAGVGAGYKFLPTLTQDRVNNTPVGFTCTARTSWLDFGDPSLRKLLNWMQVMTDDTGLLVSVDGASLRSDFASPRSVIANGSLIASPFKDLSLYLAGKTTRDRFYRFTFTSTNSNAPVFVGGFDLRGFGWANL